MTCGAGVHELVGRAVALKVLSPFLLEKPGFIERFWAEAGAAPTINHPGVVVVYDCVIDESAETYLVMEYIEGDVLSHTLARLGRLTPVRTGRWWLRRLMLSTLGTKRGSCMVR